MSEGALSAERTTIDEYCISRKLYLLAHSRLCCRNSTSSVWSCTSTWWHLAGLRSLVCHRIINKYIFTARRVQLLSSSHIVVWNGWGHVRGAVDSRSHVLYKVPPRRHWQDVIPMNYSPGHPCRASGNVESHLDPLSRVRHDIDCVAPWPDSGMVVRQARHRTKGRRSPGCVSPSVLEREHDIPEI